MFFQIICLDDALRPFNLQATAISAIGINSWPVVVGQYSVVDTTNKTTQRGFLLDLTVADDPIVKVEIGSPTSVTFTDPPYSLPVDPSKFMGFRPQEINDNGLIVGRIDYGDGVKVERTFAFQVKAERVSGSRVIQLEEIHILSEDVGVTLAGGRHGKITETTPTTGTNFHAHGVNNNGEIVGIFQNAAGQTRGFRFTPQNATSGQWDGLIEEIDGGGEFTQLYGISDDGFMAGTTGQFDGTPDMKMKNEMIVWEPQGGVLFLKRVRLQNPDNPDSGLELAPWGIAHKITKHKNTDIHLVVGEAPQIGDVSEVTGSSFGWQSSFIPYVQGVHPVIDPLTKTQQFRRQIPQLVQTFLVASDTTVGCADTASPSLNCSSTSATGLSNSWTMVGSGKIEGRSGSVGWVQYFPI